MRSNAAAPNAVRPRGISAESKSRIAILMSRNDDPHVRAMQMERSQSREVKFAFGSIGLRVFNVAHFRQPSNASALVYSYARRLSGSWSFD